MGHGPEEHEDYRCESPESQHRCHFEMLTNGFHEGRACRAYTWIPAPHMEKAGAEGLGFEAPAPKSQKATHDVSFKVLRHLSV